MQAGREVMRSRPSLANVVTGRRAKLLTIQLAVQLSVALSEEAARQLVN